MTRADTSTLVGRSRDTLAGAAPLPPTPTIPLRRVILRLWSLSPAQLPDAETAATVSAGAALWDLAETVRSSGGLCPIPLGDPLALDQGADYGYAWAVYRAAHADA